MPFKLKNYPDTHHEGMRGVEVGFDLFFNMVSDGV
jgi:hypothetical protein